MQAGRGEQGEAQRQAARPLGLGTEFALLAMPEAGAPISDTAVVFINPCGFDELGIRKFYRIIADQLCDMGMASLRFELPGTANSAWNRPDCRWHDWVAAVQAAMDLARAETGATRIVLAGHATGASLALGVAGLRADVCGLVLMAPVLSGAAFLKDLAILSRRAAAINRRRGPETELEFDWAEELPPGIAADLQAMTFDAIRPPQKPAMLVVSRPNRAADQDYVAALQSRGQTVDTFEFRQHDLLIKDLNASRVPFDVAAQIALWCGRQGQGLAALAGERTTGDRVEIKGPGYVENVVRFGDRERMLGILCQPQTGKPRAVCLLLTTAYHPMAGFARINVEAARQLAAQGIASLRFDPANAGDSPPIPGIVEADDKGRVIWRKSREWDVRDAIAFLKQSGQPMDNLLIAGRCSGAYLAFISAVEHAEIKGAVLANPFLFDWPEGQTLRASAAFVPQPPGAYVQKLFRGETWKRIAANDIHLFTGGLNMGRALARRLKSRVAERLGFHSADKRRIMRRLRVLARRGTKLRLIYSHQDTGLMLYSTLFGSRGQELQSFSNVSVELLDCGDHNLSVHAARERFLQQIVDLADGRG